MKRLMLATIAGAALLTGVGAASAQTFYSEGPYYYGDGPFVERGVGLQVGPVGVGVYGPTYYDGGWYHGWRSRAFRGDHTHSTYNMRAFRSQELWPQSPPGGS
jgi:hypothetical protein